MNEKREPLVKITAEKATEVYHSELTEQARELLSAELSPADFLDALTSADLIPDAIRFLAHSLPKVDAVRWACNAAEGTMDRASKSELRCLESALAWVDNDAEDNRRGAMEAADAAGYSGAAGWAAAAAGWSGGSMAPPELEDVPPPEQLTGTAAASAVLLASVACEPHLVKPTQRELLEAGLALAAEP